MHSALKIGIISLTGPISATEWLATTQLPVETFSKKTQVILIQTVQSLSLKGLGLNNAADGKELRPPR
jgi:hypothetical protein